MTHSDPLSNLSLHDTWLTIGVFDGVHLGHQALLRALVEGAAAAGCTPLALTFDPHPAVVLGGRADFQCLTTLAERTALLQGLGVRQVLVQPFDTTFANQTAEDFMRRVSRALGLRRLIIGYDFALGRGRRGDAAALANLGISLGYALTRVEPLRLEGGRIISSTAIRTAVREGDLPEATAMLGRYFSLSGVVKHGEGRGRMIQFPTVNLDVPSGKILPPNGIYACRAWRGGQLFSAATNIGTNPTFTPDKHTPNVEAYLLDFDGDLYGQEIRLEFVQRLRDELKFASVEALVDQIRVDVAETRRVLGSAM